MPVGGTDMSLKRLPARGIQTNVLDAGTGLRLLSGKGGRAKGKCVQCPFHALGKEGLE
jgi:hypothetical protein